MGNVKDLDSTAIYAWTTLISVLICVPCAVIFEGGTLKAGMQRAAEAHPDFYYKLAAVGLLYHLYNQVSCPPGECKGIRYGRQWALEHSC